MPFHKLLITTILSAAALAITACNGNGNGNGAPTPTTGPGTPTVTPGTPTPGAGGLQWQQRGGGTSNQVPPSVTTVRIVFQSEGGESCCVAVDPLALGNFILVLDNLQPGPAVVSVAGFGTDFAPAVPGVTETCETIPAEVAEACDPTRVAPPAYESDPLPVTIVAGVQTDIGTVDLNAYPYALDAQPGQGETVVPTPSAPYPIVPFAFTVADAVTNIQEESVALELMFTVQESGGFRMVTKRVPLQEPLVPCEDGTTTPCSDSGTQDLAGFKATGVAEALPTGCVDVHISAQNTDDVPRDLDFRYGINVQNTGVNVRAIGASLRLSTPEAASVSASGGARVLNLRAIGRSMETSNAAPVSAGRGAGNGMSAQPQSVVDPAARAGPRATTTPVSTTTDSSNLRPAAVTPSPTATLTPAPPAAGEP